MATVHRLIITGKNSDMPRFTPRPKNTGMTPASGAPAVLERSTIPCKARSAEPQSAGHLLGAVVEACTVALGLTVFGLIAGFFLVLV